MAGCVRGGFFLLALTVVAGIPGGGSAASPTPNGRIAFTSNWAENLSAEIYGVDVATGRRVNLTRHADYDNAPVVSPDGRTILFRSSRDNFNGIWRMNADGSGQRPLARGELPAWSPDSSRIAFVDLGANVTVVAADGSGARSIGRGTAPSWSPDGRSLAYLDFDSSIVVADAADETGARVVFTATRIAPALIWSPDGSELAVTAEVLLDSGGVLRSAVVAVPAAGGEPRVLTRGDDHDPAWSPNGGRIAFSRAGRVFTVPAAGGSATRVTAGPTGSFDGRPRWSPDGRWLAFARGPAENAFRELWVVPAAGGAARRVRREDARAQLASFDGLAWTPDSRSVLYSQWLPDNDRDVWAVDADGSRLRRLTTNDVDDHDPAFSPDGRSIAFVRTLRTGEILNEELYLMRPDGSGARRLTRWSGDDLAPAWSPDGSRIVFVRRTTGREPLLSLYTIRLDGTALVRLRTPDAFYDSPAWAPDGSAIVATGEPGASGGVEEGGSLNLFASDGRRLRRLIPLGDDVARHPTWSPDGSRITFVRETTCRTCFEFDLWEVGRRGERPRELATDVLDAAWSPDGSRLAAVSPTGQLRLLGADGRTVRALPVGRSEGWRGISWQPRCTLAGGPAGDRLPGRPSADLVCGLGGDDRLVGGSGRDRLFGGQGDDRIDARDRVFDIVGCGGGRDVVLADRVDLVGVDCEQVTRR